MKKKCCRNKAKSESISVRENERTTRIAIANLKTVQFIFEFDGFFFRSVLYIFIVDVAASVFDSFSFCFFHLFLEEIFQFSLHFEPISSIADVRIYSYPCNAHSRIPRNRNAAEIGK